MKMFGEKSISAFLFYVSRIVVFGFIVFILFLVFGFLNENLITISNNEFQVKLPIVDLFVKGQYESKVIAAIFSTLLFYGIFFYILSLVFKVFKQPTIFNEKAISSLSRFVVINLLACIVLIGINFIVTNELLVESMVYGILHIILAVFVGFVMAIFKQGFQLQQENDLTI